MTYISVAVPKPRAEEPKLNCIPELELRTAAPVPFPSSKTCRNFLEKIMVSQEVFVNYFKTCINPRK
jgi:hypothetical protein